ncbi:MAG TPA: L-threonylcarbamoyladenylate synthase [Alphaproteobacteria bacterium]|nr:L-threonylcarbamoyladenylate synthase [Alphaproteobacteria bacterium]
MNDTLLKALELLKKGRLIGLPTETVYGLAADATNDQAVASIYALKGRPKVNPLIIHVSCKQMAKKYVKWNEKAELLAEKFWPGPLTLVLPLKPHTPLSLLVTAGLSTVAVRVPNHKLALELLENYPHPLAAPSANISMSMSPTSASHVIDAFKEKLELVLDGGDCQVGLESTIVDLSEKSPALLRPGGISTKDLEAVLKEKLPPSTTPLLKAPGMMKRHYAPSKPLRLNALNIQKDEALLGFGKTILPVAFNLSEKGDLKEAASQLFRMLRVMDKLSVSRLAVMPIPNEGLGQAINDRLLRAATT